MDDRRSFALTRAGGGRIFGRAARDFSSQRVTSARSACLSLRLKFVHKACLDEFVVVVDLHRALCWHDVEAANIFGDSNAAQSRDVERVQAILDLEDETHWPIRNWPPRARSGLGDHLANFVQGRLRHDVLPRSHLRCLLSRFYDVLYGIVYGVIYRARTSASDFSFRSRNRIVAVQRTLGKDAFDKHRIDSDSSAPIENKREDTLFRHEPPLKEICHGVLRSTGTAKSHGLVTPVLKRFKYLLRPHVFPLVV
jgi:hypothetical protein